MSSSSQQTNEASKLNAIKDQAVGTVKEALGNVLGNNKMELEGKAQKVHGKIEYQYAKAIHDGDAEPEKFQQAYHPQNPSELQYQEAPQQQPPAPMMGGQAPPAPMMGAQVPPPAPPVSQQPTQTSNDPSQMNAWKDQAVGAMKENWGNVTNQPQMEMEGKAQNLHGKNEAQFAKAKKEGLNEPQHFEHGTKTTSTAEGSVEGDKVSSMSAMKDKAVGAMKETWGSATGNTNTELAGKAQQMHGRNEAEFAKAQKQGLSEPEHYAQGTKNTERAEGSVEGDKVSSMSAMKDKTVGAMKETWGSATGNQNAELVGKAQQMHGRNEAEFAKAQKQGLNEPEHYAKGTKETHHAEGTVEGENVSTLGALKDRALGSMKETFGSMTGNQNMELKGKAQQMHGRNEAEFAKAQKQGLSEPEHFAHGKKMPAEGEIVSNEPSKMSGWKDQAVGSMKETFGSATNNPDMELKGKAQQMHGRNEAEFAKAQQKGLSEPEHFGQGTKMTERAEGSVEGDKVSSMSAMKDKAVGAMKETWGSATGNQNAELVGKAQQMHGRNEAEFAKAQKQGLNEPEYYAKGTKETHHAQGEVVGEDSSKMSGWKDQAVGSVKESVGNMTNNQKMELEGKAQKMQGANTCERADAKKNPMNA